MQHTFIIYISLILIILLLVMLAERLKVAYPIILVLGGLTLSFFDGINIISINPELIFIIFLPPLLYEAAWYTSWKNLWRWRRVIVSFAFLIVLVTSLVVAVVSSLLIPGFTLALGFLLGGIVSPPDAVSASSVMKYVRIPRSMTSIIEGESLLNDASSLIVFRFALIAVDTGRFVFHEAALSFVVVIVAGVLIGVAVGLIYYAIYKWLPTSTNMDIVLSLTAPYVMYIAAESIHVSGVLSVVAGGLFLSVKSHLYMSQRSRLRGGNVWSTLGFVLNGLVFMLIGLELPHIIGQLGEVRLSQAIGYGLLITGVLVVGRILSTLGASAFTVWVSKYITTADSRPGWKNPLIFGWAGMRGVVSLAAALSIPLHLQNGAPFPQRNLILFITFTVILLTLVVQGLTLPLVIKWLHGGENRDITLPHRDQELILRKKLSYYSLQLLDGEHKQTVENNRPLQQLRERFANDQLPQDENANLLHEDYRRVYLQLLDRQREVLHQLNKKDELDDEIIRKYLTMLDLEEEKLRMKFEGV
ncbi:Na+/H+ antiporter [Flavitalea sp. BT771]|uniref:Na+/H+ antiporter n=1 Tax=Flavitalea sp. BT771 TaxID=3063329 RepID=UPI0026E3B3B9|nr:Na+/H+ antiporter [Flavitalea sp. BT771]MDO6433687.1 Na+/H+ antiporter [Flavitalea sp. BT771]MDV6222408.1 Na+/H+ antiporter [Flavitalea sp. BT771]